MSEYDVSFSKLPEQTFDKLESGIYILKIADIIKEKDEEYGTKYTMTHEVVGTGRKINYDNYKLFNAKGEPEIWGQGKLRTLLEALNITNLEQINVKVLQAVAVGEMFKAKCEVNDKGFLNISYAEIYPLNEPREALNPIGNSTAKVVSVNDSPDISPEILDEINDDDI